MNDNGLNGVSLVNNLVASANTVFCNGYTDKYSYELYAGDATLVMPLVVTNQQIIAKKPASFSASVLQNPVGNTVKINVASDVAQTINVTCSDVNGNVRTLEKATLYKGNNNVIVNAGNWQTGVYLIKLCNASGDVVSFRVFK